MEHIAYTCLNSCKYGLPKFLKLVSSSNYPPKRVLFFYVVLYVILTESELKALSRLLLPRWWVLLEAFKPAQQASFSIVQASNVASGDRQSLQSSVICIRSLCYDYPNRKTLMLRRRTWSLAFDSFGSPRPHHAVCLHCITLRAAGFNLATFLIVSSRCLLQVGAVAGSTGFT